MIELLILVGIGLAVGFIADAIDSRSTLSLLAKLVIGVLSVVVGGWLVGLFLGVETEGNLILQVLVGVVFALLALWAARKFADRSDF